MAKDKTKKGVPNKHLHARIAFLHQAANYLNSQSTQNFKEDEVTQTAAESVVRDDLKEGRSENATDATGNLGADSWHSQANSRARAEGPNTSAFDPPRSGLPLQLNAHLRAVAQKAQIRLSQEMKHSICKVCSSPLIVGETCIRSTENMSKGGRKPWADVLILKCRACGACKRFPVGAKKQKRKALRIENGAKRQGGDNSNVEVAVLQDDARVNSTADEPLEA